MLSPTTERTDHNGRTDAIPVAIGDCSAGHQDWWDECRQRMHRDLVATALGICFFNWVFFTLYFLVLHHPAGAVTAMPLTPLDRAIALTPQALPLYVSLWVYVGLGPGLMKTRHEALVYAAWIGALCGFGLVVFYFFPTAVPLRVLPIDTVFQRGFALLHGIDAAGNACPSLHVATAVFTAAWVHRLLTEMRAPGWVRAGNATWMLLIVWSTLAVKQHVVLDALAGALLGLAFAWVSMRRPIRA
ncbi:MAG: phosphatase PAP2 family protein [Rubrivivax sp.]